MFEDKDATGEDASEKADEEVMKNVDDNNFEDSIECQVCKQIFLIQRDFENHVCDKAAKHVSCPICQKTFPLSFRLKHHLRIHSGKKFYECDICKERFADKNHIATHLKHSTDVIKRYKCEVCEKTYRNAVNLKEHMYTHTGEKPHKCEQCGKEFMLQTVLKAHIATHKNKKPTKRHLDDNSGPLKSSSNDSVMLKCQKCFKTILRKFQLKKHLQIHKDYECLICNENYKDCKCSDDQMEVSKSKHTYQKRSKPAANVLTGKIVESDIDIKKEVIEGTVVKNEEKLVSEIIKPKEEPKEEEFEIGESSVESFTFVTVKPDEDDDVQH